jgi:hypothetical protein
VSFNSNAEPDVLSHKKVANFTIGTLLTFRDE